MSQLVIVDYNNFWSPSGGGVRRYHLERMKYYKNHPDALLVFVQNDGKTYTKGFRLADYKTYQGVPLSRKLGIPFSVEANRFEAGNRQVQARYY